MKINSKIAAFTILELIVAIILGSVFISLSYSLISSMAKRWGQVQTQNSEITSLLLFKKTLQRDIDSAAYILCNNKSDSLTLFIDKTIVSYQLGSVIIRKKGLFQDSFKISVGNVRPTLIRHNGVNKTMRSLTMDFLSPLKMSDVQFNRYYSSKDLMDIPE